MSSLMQNWLNKSKQISTPPILTEEVNRSIPIDVETSVSVNVPNSNSSITLNKEKSNDPACYDSQIDLSSNKNEPPTQPKLIEYPGASFGNKTRRFNANYFNKFPWLEYSIVRDKCFCNTCRHLGHENEQRISQIFTNLEIGFGDWKNMARSFEVHESSDYHQISSKAKIIYLNANANKDNDFINQLNKAKIKSIKDNRYYLTAIIQSILF